MIIVLAGGPSSERSVSFWTAKTITESLQKQGKTYHLIDPSEPTWFETLQKLSPDVVVLALHGIFGEDGNVQKILESHKIPFTGSSSDVAKLSFDKQAVKEIVQKLGIATPRWRTVSGEKDLSGTPIPAVVKPNKEGSSYGITLVWSQHELQSAVSVAADYDSTVLIEEYITGTELTCAVTDLFGEVQALPLVEIRPHADFFDFKSKYTAEECDEICPAELNPTLTEQIQKLSISIFKKLGLRQYGRVDWILKNGEPYFLEINSLPGLTKTSLFNKSLTAAGISFDQFLEKLLDSSTRTSHK